MIGGYGITEDSQGARSDDIRDVSNSELETAEIGRVMDIVAFLIPLINHSRCRGDLIPFRILTGKVAVELSKNFRRKG